MHTETLLSLCVSVQPEKREQPTGKGWSVMSSCNVFWNAIVVLYIPASSNDDMSVVLYQLLYLIFHISLSHVFFNQSFKNCLNPTTSTTFKPKVKKRTCQISKRFMEGIQDDLIYQMLLWMFCTERMCIWKDPKVHKFTDLSGVHDVYWGPFTEFWSSTDGCVVLSWCDVTAIHQLEYKIRTSQSSYV